jgi:uncharacterized protein (UPF0264 family)
MRQGQVMGVRLEPTRAGRPGWTDSLRRRGSPALLVSVADAQEAAEALMGGAHMIDVKDPSRGALGMPARDAFTSVCERVAGSAPVTLALGEAGDPPGPGWAGLDDPALERAALVKAAAWGADWRRGLGASLAGVAPDRRVAAVYVDRARRDGPGVEEVIAWAVDTAAAGVLLDTRVKDGRCLFDHAPARAVAAWVTIARGAGLLITLAGSLRGESLRLAGSLGPDLAAVRGAACDGGDRRGRVRRDAVAQALAMAQLRPDTGGVPARA